jgi:hypothetical protein
MAGVDAVLGPEAFYCAPESLEQTLPEELARIAALPRPDLHRRGRALRERIASSYSWEWQAATMAEFIGSLPPPPT